MEKTSAEFFAEEVEQGKLLTIVQEALDDLKRRKIEIQKQIHDLHKQVKDIEIEQLPLIDKVRKAKQNMAEAKQKGWATRHSGL